MTGMSDMSSKNMGRNCGDGLVYEGDIDRIRRERDSPICKKSIMKSSSKREKENHAYIA